MKPRVEARAGDRYGRYVLVELVEVNARGQRWNVRCDCGSLGAVSLAALRANMRTGGVPKCRSCGAAQRAVRVEDAGESAARRAAVVVRADREDYTPDCAEGLAELDFMFTVRSSGRF